MSLLYFKPNTETIYSGNLHAKNRNMSILCTFRLFVYHMEILNGSISGFVSDFNYFACIGFDY